MKKYISLILIIFLIAFSGLSPVAAATSNEADNDSVETVTKKEIVIDKSNLSMRFNTENSLITVTDKRNNFVWTSNLTDVSNDEVISGATRTEARSQIIVEFAGKNEIQKTNNFSGSVSYDNASYKTIKDGVRAEYKFEDNGFTIPVEYVLTDNSLIASVIYKDIKEESSNKVVSVSVLPYFGAEQSKTENGYLFVPDGSGAIIAFDDIENGISTTYEKYVYGDNLLTPDTLQTAYKKEILVPVFGMKANDNAFAAIITKGAANAKIAAGARGQSADCCNVYSKGIYRDVTFVDVTMQDGSKSASMFLSDAETKIDAYKTEYSFLFKESADYVGIAEVYRNHLLESGVEKTATGNTELYVDLYGGILEQANFLGIPYKTVAELTTTEQVVEILKELKKSDVKNISLGLKAFSKSTIKNMPEIDIKPVKKLGGKSGLKEILEYSENNNVSVYPYADYFDFNQNGNGIGSNKTKVYSLEKSPAKLYDYSIADNYRVKTGDKISFIRPEMYDYSVSKIIKSISKFDSEGVALSSISSNLISDNSKDYISRNATLEILADSLSKLDEKSNIITASSNDYMWKFSYALTDLPTSSSRYSYFTYDIPFLQIVLKGVKDYSCEAINYSGFSRDSFLKCIESGSNIKFEGIYASTSKIGKTELDYLFGAGYKDWLEKAAEWNTQIEALNSKIGNSRIIAHKVSDGTAVTEYENGVKVYVNFSAEDKLIDGVSVKAENYMLKEG